MATNNNMQLDKNKWLVENYLRNISINFSPNICNSLAVNATIKILNIGTYMSEQTV